MPVDIVSFLLGVLSVHLLYTLSTPVVQGVG